MIDPNEYIASGKLEEYVLGIGSTDIMQEVECMSRVFPEIKEEIAALRLALEKNAMSSAVTPRAELKNNIFKAIDDLPPLTIDGAKLSEGTTISNPSTSNNSLLKWMIALLALSSVFFGYKNCNQAKQLDDTIRETNLNSTAANHVIDSLTQLSLALRSQIEIINNPNGVAIHMAGTKLYPSGQATIYFDKAKQTVYLNSGNLPVTPSGKHYQLWGIVDGKPVSLGVFESTSSNSIQSMQSVAPNVSTFAVTLEPAGGSVNPTMDQMYVAGNVAGL